MKKTVLIGLFLVTAAAAFSQRLSTVGILPFEIQGEDVSEAEAEEAARLTAAELSSWGTMAILTGEEAETGEYLVRGQIARENGRLVLSASTSDRMTGRTLNGATTEGPELSAISMTPFCAQIAENIPYPNYLLGKWRAVITMDDGPLNCVLEFRSDRTIRVERFDTWEHDGTNILKYQARGSGAYSYAGYLRRTLTIDRRQIETDATVGLNLNLEDALPKYRSLRAGGLRLLFNEEKTSLELVYGGIPCGDNRGGSAVYPGTNVYYTKFTKIQ